MIVLIGQGDPFDPSRESSDRFIFLERVQFVRSALVFLSLVRASLTKESSEPPLLHCLDAELIA